VPGFLSHVLKRTKQYQVLRHKFAHGDQRNSNTDNAELATADIRRTVTTMHQSTHDNQNCNIRLSNSHTTLRVGTVCISVGFRLNALRTRTSKKMRPMLQRTLVQHSINGHQNCSIRLSNSHSSVGEGTVQISWAFSFSENHTQTMQNWPPLTLGGQ